ncbi:glycoside hydrolase family 16 protein [Pseudonocardia sp. ICBG601]|uniref:glycoside hydrolase family 16 protein n=1 Tax=Pseudonocardia sp. ICBG601 TaxID=2846759 RepID=UPI001CF70950|nr:glycoside hydrolase family 16 protein [Pseudonocardia sp. ICBG601]
MPFPHIAAALTLAIATAFTPTHNDNHTPNAPKTASTTISHSTAIDNKNCSWKISALSLYHALRNDNSSRTKPLRQHLENAGVTDPDFIPDRCTSIPDNNTDNNTGGGSHPDENNAQRRGNPTSPAPPGNSGTSENTPSAGETFNWGPPEVIDDFDGDLDRWSLYDGPGHDGNGTRSPDAATTSNGILTIHGSADGTTAGLAWPQHSQHHGRWEVRMKAPTGSPSYNALALLWPTQENFPIGGEIDFAEIMDPERKKIELFLHYGADNSQVHGELDIDATQWHNYAVEWTPDAITAFVDGKEWWKTTDTSISPPGPMHLTLQLDWFPKGDNQTGEVHYDWVKQWALNNGDKPSTTTPASEGSTDADSSTTATDEENNWNGRSRTNNKSSSRTDN